MLSVNPFDIAGTSRALEQVVDEGAAGRITRSVALREAVAAHTPGDWVRDGLCAAAAYLERL